MAGSGLERRVVSGRVVFSVSGGEGKDTRRGFMVTWGFRLDSPFCEKKWLSKLVLQFAFVAMGVPDFVAAGGDVFRRALHSDDLLLREHPANRAPEPQKGTGAGEGCGGGVGEGAGRGRVLGRGKGGCQGGVWEGAGRGAVGRGVGGCGAGEGAGEGQGRVQGRGGGGAGCKGRGRMRGRVCGGGGAARRGERCGTQDASPSGRQGDEDGQEVGVRGCKNRKGGAPRVSDWVRVQTTTLGPVRSVGGRIRSVTHGWDHVTKRHVSEAELN